jgi:glycosyltransferase involved in cell wall biosynthesis
MEFSIIIPAKNEEKNIGNCLDSINAMHFEPHRFEVLVVDNGSSDRTVEIAWARGARVFEKPGLTISGLRNFGAGEAKGEVLAFLDADCTVAPDWLDEASRYMGNQEVACFGGPPGIPENATWVQKTWFRVREKKELVREVEWLESMNMFVPRQTFLAAGGFNEKLVTCEDYDLSLRLKRFGKIVADRRIVAVHHGEATDLRHFFRKEHWRATSNFSGLKSHGFHWKEMPSLVAPSAYLLLFLLALGALLVGILPAGEVPVSGWVALAILWQGPLVLLAIRKSRDSWNPLAACQLFLLLNIYFMARGLAVFRGR